MLQRFLCLEPGLIITLHESAEDPYIISAVRKYILRSSKEEVKNILADI